MFVPKLSHLAYAPAPVDTHLPTWASFLVLLGLVSSKRQCDGTQRLSSCPEAQYLFGKTLLKCYSFFFPRQVFL